MHEFIIEAINSRRCLSIIYRNKQRIVEPQCYGQGNAGKNLLRVYQVSPGVPALRLFVVDDKVMQDVKILPETFAGPGPKYQKNDRAMRKIYAQL